MNSPQHTDNQLIMEEIYKKLNYQPTGFTDHELENPLPIITYFCESHALHELREKAWQLYKGWVNSSSSFADGEENADMLFFYTQLIEFFNASYVYTEMKKQEDLKFKA